ncbi:Os10g0520600, partial [Oryza sativa Japonica Group]
RSDVTTTDSSSSHLGRAPRLTPPLLASSFVLTTTAAAAAADAKSPNPSSALGLAAARRHGGDRRRQGQLLPGGHRHLRPRPLHRDPRRPQLGPPARRLLHHPDTPAFCGGCLCAEPVAAFIDENFVAWGGSIRRTEGFKMSNSLNASRFPFCAVVMASTNQRIVLLRQIEGPKSPEEMITTLQGAVEECSASLVAARIDAEERLNNQRLREEQDAAYRAALEADQARERQRREEQEKREREAAEAERKRKEEEEAQERAAQEAAEKEAALARRRQEKAMALGAEPEKGPDVTRVLIRFPTGERKERRFNSSTTITSLYDYVDSLDCLKAEKYSLVSNFPRVTYGPEKLSQTLEEAGLHPQASLFIEIEQ